MTFWTDAKPATPRFRLRRPRVLAIAVVAVAIVLAVGIVVARAGGGPDPAAAAARRREPTRKHEVPVIPARWSATLRDYPQRMLSDGRDDVIVIGDNWVSEIDAGDGDSHWRAHTERLNARAALRGDTILLSTEPGFVALDRATGAQRWRTDTPETPGAVALVGPAGTPAVAVVATDEGGLVGLDSRRGTARWSVRLPGYIAGVPAPDDASGLLATVWWEAGGSHLRLIDAATGAVRWEHAMPHMAGSPTIADGPDGHRLVIVGAGSGAYDSEVRAYELVSGALRWRAPAPASFQPEQLPLVDGDDVYVMDQLSHVTRLDLATGKRRWSTDTHSIATDGRPSRSGSVILVTNFTDDVFTLDRATGAIRARRRTVGYPIAVLVAHRTLLVAERLVEQRQIQAFPANRIAASARRPE